jgi:hypothetical protein
MTARFEKRDFKKIFLYLDILVIAIFSVSLVVLIRDAYVTGFYEQRVADLYALSFWAMARDAVFVVGSLSWLFYRYLRVAAREFTDPWA